MAQQTMAEADPASQPGPPAPEFTCPHCGGLFVAELLQTQVMICPHCRQEMVVRGLLDEGTLPGEPAPDPRSVDHGDLDGDRIAKIARLRRSVHRSRMYCIIAAVGCGAVSLQLGWNSVAALRQFGWSLWPPLYALGGLAFGMGAALFTQRALILGREAQHSALAQPTDKADFSPLSDGSQRWTGMGGE